METRQRARHTYRRRVADRAGCGLTTVQRVLTDDPNARVDPELAARVRRAASDVSRESAMPAAVRVTIAAEVAAAGAFQALKECRAHLGEERYDLYRVRLLASLSDLEHAVEETY